MSKKNAESATAPARDDDADDFMQSHENSEPRRIPIRFVRFLSKGQMIATPRDHYDSMTAREKGAPAGYDIFLHLEEHRFRFDHYDGGRLQRSKYLHVSRVDDYEELGQSPSPNNAA